MSTTIELLNELNELRAARQQQPLKSWKGSRAALEQTLTAYKIKKVEPAVAEGAYPNSKVAEASTELKGKHEKARQAIAKANKPKSGDEVKGAKDSGITTLRANKRPRDPKTTARDDGLTSLADIARELKIEPKLARAKARRSTEIQKLAQGDAWAFKSTDVAAVKKILSGK